jgi:hypothetical protein
VEVAAGVGSGALVPQVRNRLHCDACWIALDAPNLHWEDLRLAAMRAGWEMDTPRGDLCPDCQLLPALIDDVGGVIQAPLPGFGGRLLLHIPGLDDAEAVLTTAVVLLAGRVLAR